MSAAKQIAIVTGASSGIGRAIAVRLSSAGYSVYGTSRRPDTAGQQAFDILPLDVTQDASVDATVHSVLQKHGRIDLLVNNAGIGVAPAAAEESSMAQAQAIFDTNFFGLVRMTRAVIPSMRKRGTGRIINIGSALGFIPLPYGALYSATKHAVEGYSQSIDHELRTLGIRVSVVEPAYTRTDFEANMLEADAPLSEYAQIRIALRALMPKLIANGDDPGLVAEVVLKAATARRPKLRYTAGRTAGLLQALRSYAPAAVLDAGLRRDLKLDT